MARQTISFLDLPSEIRNAIYDSIDPNPSKNTIVSLDLPDPQPRFEKPIHQLSRQIRHEALSRSFGRRVFVATSIGALTIFLHRLGPLRRSYVADLLVHWDHKPAQRSNRPDGDGIGIGNDADPHDPAVAFALLASCPGLHEVVLWLDARRLLEHCPDGTRRDTPLESLCELEGAAQLRGVRVSRELIVYTRSRKELGRLFVSWLKKGTGQAQGGGVDGDAVC